MRLGTTQGASNVWNLTLGYGPPANNNGNVLIQEITGPGLSGTASQSYTYDDVNRLKTMAEAGGCAQLYSYDRYGNRAVVTGTGYCVPSTTYTPNLAVDSESQVEQIFPNNRWTGATHNLVGNQTALPGWTFAYDGENRVKTATSSLTSATYVYDGEGRRVKRTVNGAATTYVYDAMGNLAAEYGGETVAGGRVYLTTDHLGSTRLVTNSSGTAVECRDYFPFGEEMTSGTRAGCYAGDVAKQKFTGKERDQETGLDYFGARYFSGAQGRFTSADEFTGGAVDPFTRQQVSQPGPLPYADIANPQSLNKYAYVLNNPLRYTDPDGHCPICIAIMETVASPAGQVVLEKAGTYVSAATGAAIGYLGGRALSERLENGSISVLPGFPMTTMPPGVLTWRNNAESAQKQQAQGQQSTPADPDGKRPDLKSIHKDETLDKTRLEGLRNVPTETIVDSLKPGEKTSLKVKPDGRVMDGNHRIKVLKERGVDVNKLPRDTPE